MKNLTPSNGQNGKPFSPDYVSHRFRDLLRKHRDRGEKIKTPNALSVKGFAWPAWQDSNLRPSESESIKVSFILSLLFPAIPVQSLVAQGFPVPSAGENRATP